MAAQRHDAGAGAADVAQQQLQQRAQPMICTPLVCCVQATA
jgi:hypothetical protein